MLEAPVTIEPGIEAPAGADREIELDLVDGSAGGERARHQILISAREHLGDPGNPEQELG
jgi:hypothetical protein